jgi:DNA polymerase II large subunit
MAESAWHKKVREEIWNSLKPNAFSSHSDVSKLELFRGPKKRENCLSDVDIVEITPDRKDIIRLIEIETAMNPKKLIGIVLATHLCDRCKTPYKEYSLDKISLSIICRKEKEKSKKPLKLAVIKRALDELLFDFKIPGCLAKYDFQEHL